MTYDDLCESILAAQEELLKHEVEANKVILNGKKYGKLMKPGYKPTIFGMSVEFANLPNDYEFLVQYEPPKPKTNADRIRAMSDEELAKTLPWIGQHRICPNVNCDADNWEPADCEKCYLDWLRQEASE